MKHAENPKLRRLGDMDRVPNWSAVPYGCKCGTTCNNCKVASAVAWDTRAREGLKDHTCSSGNTGLGGNTAASLGGYLAHTVWARRLGGRLGRRLRSSLGRVL